MSCAFAVLFEAVFVDSEDSTNMKGSDVTDSLLRSDQVRALQSVLYNRTLVLCFGGGVDSTAMLIALREAELVPELILMADTDAEKPETWEHVERIKSVLADWEWPSVIICKKTTQEATGYTDLEGNCLSNETLPSLAFGMKSCSLKWKAAPQDAYIKGVRRGPNRRPPNPIWLRAQARGEKLVKLIGYDNGRADRRRAGAVDSAGADFDYAYPLQLIGWTRVDCVNAIMRSLGAEYVPIKSACFFCPASKEWELWWLVAAHPDLFERALLLERRALTGRHSRFNEVEFGASWEDLVRNADRFPSTTTTVGLGRSFAWNQWARVHDVVDADFKVRIEHRERFAQMADRLRRTTDNAFDSRAGLATTHGRCARIAQQTELELA